MGKKVTLLRDIGTDEAIVALVAKGGGDIPRRDIVRRLGQRTDLVASMNRLIRLKKIELISVPSAGRRPLARIRLIGDTAAQHGAGYIKMGGKP